ncbi:MAG: DNA repair protein RecO [Lachnospirales bacterium]
MSVIDLRGIVIREVDVNESNKMLTLLVKDRGKYSVLAKGAKKTKSKIFTVSQMFAYSDITIFEKNNFNILTQGDLIESFYSIREDFEKLCYSNYFLEIINKTILEDVEVNSILKLLLNALKKMCITSEPKLVFVTFQVKFLQLIGHNPPATFCSSCNKPYTQSNKVYFGDQGLICPDCISTTPRIHQVNHTFIYTLNYIYENENIFNFHIPNSVINMLEKTLNDFIKINLDINLKSLEILN